MRRELLRGVFMILHMFYKDPRDLMLKVPCSKSINRSNIFYSYILVLKLFISRL